MKVVGYFQSLPIDKENSLVEHEMSIPHPGPTDLLVRVKAVSVNPVDTKVRRNTQPAPGEIKILGWDASGVVERVGSQVTMFKPGDEVYYAGSILRPGTNCEYHLVDERIVAHKPQKFSHEEAAALPLTAITAYEALFERLNVLVNEHESILIFGGAGGVGSMAIQLAKALTHLRVIATASRVTSREWCKKLGADFVLDHQGDIHGQLREQGIDQVKYILCLTHSQMHRETMEKVIAPQGHLCLIDDPQGFAIQIFKRKSVAIHWESMFTRSTYETPDMIEQHKILEKVAELADRGRIQTTIRHFFDGLTADNLKKAHALSESERTIGKIVIKF